MKERTIRLYTKRLRKHLADSTAASAALLFNRLPELALLDDRQRFAALEQHLKASILAFCEFAPKPSSN